MDTLEQLTPDKDLAAVVAGLPIPIREFFSSGKVRVVIKEIFDTCRLHIDATTIAEREVLLLLLGLKNPSEFVLALKEEAGIDSQTIDGIVRIVNDRIFVPLQQKMREGGGPVPRPAQASVPSYQAAKPPASINPPMQQVPIAPPPPPRAPAPQVPRPSITIPLAPRPIASATPPAQPMPAPQIQRPMQVLVKPTPQGPMSVPQTVQRQAPPPPPNLPGVMNPDHLLPDHETQHINVPSMSVQPPLPAQPAAPRAMPTAPPPPKPIIKYSVDPYREPFDEK